jgi:hypothetical protein
LDSLVTAILDPTLDNVNHLIQPTSSLNADAPAYTPQQRSNLRQQTVENYKTHFNLTQFSSPIRSMPPVPNEHFPPEQMQCIQRAITGLMFTQMSASKGIKKHGDLALTA